MNMVSLSLELQLRKSQLCTYLSTLLVLRSSKNLDFLSLLFLLLIINDLDIFNQCQYVHLRSRPPGDHLRSDILSFDIFTNLEGSIFVTCSSHSRILLILTN